PCTLVARAACSDPGQACRPRYRIDAGQSAMDSPAPARPRRTPSSAPPRSSGPLFLLPVCGRPLGRLGARAPITLHGTVTPRMTVLASVSLATFLVTSLAATQFRSQPLPPSNRLARDEALRQSVTQLEDQNRALKARIQGLQVDVKAGEDESARRSSAFQQVKAQLDDQKLIAGLTALHGAGLTILLHDGSDPNDP